MHDELDGWISRLNNGRVSSLPYEAQRVALRFVRVEDVQDTGETEIEHCAVSLF